MHDNKKVLHLIQNLLFPTETFVWQLIRKHKRYTPLILPGTEVPDVQFDFSNIEILKNRPVPPSLFKKIFARNPGKAKKYNYRLTYNEVRQHKPDILHFHFGHWAALGLN